MANVILLFSTVTQRYKYFLAVIAGKRIHPLHSNNTEKAEANESQVPDLWSQAETLVRAHPNVKEINLCPIHRKGVQKEKSRMGSHCHWPLFDSQPLCNNTGFSLRLFSFAHHSKNLTRAGFLAGFLPSLHTVAPEQRDGSSLSSSTHPCMADQPNLGSLHVRYGEGFNKFRTSFFLQSQGRMGVEAGQGTAVPKWPQRAGGDKPAEDKRAATAVLTQQPRTRLMAQVGVSKSETLGGLAAGSITPKLQPSASRGSQTFKELALL